MTGQFIEDASRDRRTLKGVHADEFMRMTALGLARIGRNSHECAGVRMNGQEFAGKGRDSHDWAGIRTKRQGFAGMGRNSHAGGPGGSKTSPRGSKNGPGGSKNGPGGSQIEPRRLPNRVPKRSRESRITPEIPGELPEAPWRYFFAICLRIFENK